MSNSKLPNTIKFISIAVFLFSCSHNIKNKDNIINYSDESIALLTKTIEGYTDLEYNYLKNKLSDPATSEKAKIWFPKAEKIKGITNEAYSIIDSCFKKISNNNFDKTKSALITTIENYKTAILQVDPEIWEVFKSNLSQIIDSNYFNGFNSADITKQIQNKIYNSISLIENRTISFCNLKTNGGCILRFEKFSVLIGQNSKHFKIGDKLEITAGVGSYSIAAQPKIDIENKNISVNDMGYAEFKKEISNNPGKYSLPVTITYYAPDGTQKRSTYEIEYFVDQ